MLSYVLHPFVLFSEQYFNQKSFLSNFPFSPTDHVRDGITREGDNIDFLLFFSFFCFVFFLPIE